MKLRKIITQITPPILLDMYRSYKPISYPKHYVWEGVYKHFRDVPIAGEGLEGDTWINITRAETEVVLTGIRNCGSIPMRVEGYRSLLPLLASVVCKHSRGIRILDFGGGLGIDYVYLTGCQRACQTIDYYVIESKKMCKEGNRLFQHDHRIHFRSSLPTDLSDIDIIHMDSVLQYIEDYAALLHALCAYRPKYFLFVRLWAGHVPTYATAQKNMPGMTIAHWFINVNEVIEIMSANGYSLMYKGASDEEYGQDNFPPQYRMERPCNLLFSRD